MFVVDRRYVVVIFVGGSVVMAVPEMTAGVTDAVGGDNDAVLVVVVIAGGIDVAVKNHQKKL